MASRKYWNRRTRRKKSNLLSSKRRYHKAMKRDLILNGWSSQIYGGKNIW